MAEKKNIGMRTLPRNEQAEAAVLGAVLVDTVLWDSVCDRVSAEDFFNEEHRKVFETMAEVVAEDLPPDVVVVAERLEATGRIERGAYALVGAFAKQTPSTANAVHYADRVREAADKRRLIEAGQSIAETAMGESERSADDLISQAEHLVFSLRGDGVGDAGRPVGASLPALVEYVDEMHERGGGLVGLSSGFREFDRMTQGLCREDLVVVAGRPSMGKTSFAMNIAENVAAREGKAVQVFSIEMPEMSLVLRMVSNMANIPLLNLRTGRLEDHEWPRLTEATGRINASKMPLVIEDKGPIFDPSVVRSRARRAARRYANTDHPLGMVVIDYLQLMRIPGFRENRTNEVGAISRQMKLLARELGVPVILLSQLNRNLETRPNKRPVMADLRESGSIEQDADLIVFLYRDEVYHEDSPERGVAEAIISKQRNGPPGTVRLAWRGEYTSFADLAPEIPESYMGPEAQDPRTHEDIVEDAIPE